MCSSDLGRNQMAMLQALIKKVCSIEFLENYNEVMDELTDMYRTNIPDELLKDLVFNQLMDGTEWTVDIYSVTGSGGSEKTYSAPNSAAYGCGGTSEPGSKDPASRQKSSRKPSCLRRRTGPHPPG